MEVVDNEDDRITVQDAAQELGVHPDTLLKAIKRGDLPARKFGRQWELSRADIEEFRARRPKIGRPPKNQPSTNLPP